MGTLDFLFQGQPPPSVTNQTTSIQGMPDWYQDYTKALIGRANTIAAEPYTPYGGSRIAGLNDKDRQAGQMVQGNVGSWQPYLNAANNLYGQAAGMSAVGAASPLINQSAQGSSIGAAQPFIGGASKTWPSSMNEYMSPYTGAVVDEIARKGTQNLMENILPGVNDTFTGGGMFGGKRHADFTNRAIRDAATGIAGEQAKALEAGYGTSANIFGQDQSRLAGLAGTVGGLASTDFGRQLQAGTTLGTLTSQDQRGLTDIGQQQANLGQMRSELGAKDAASIAALGETERGLTQKMLDSQYQDFQNQKNYPWQQVGNLSSVIRGQQIPTSTTQQYTGAGNYYSPSLASTLLGAGVGLGSLGGYI